MTESVWESLHAACPSCTSNHIGYWYHPGSDQCYFVEQKPKSGYVVQYKIGSVIEIRCDGCKSAKNIVNWKFKCPNHDYLPFKRICHSIRFHYDDLQRKTQFTKELGQRMKWNNHYYLELIAWVRRKFKLNGEIEFYENDHGDTVNIDDIDDVKSAFEYCNKFTIDIYVKLKRFRIVYGQKQFFWCPRAPNGDDDDAKEAVKDHKGEYDALLKGINKEYDIKMSEVVLEAADSKEITNNCDLLSLWSQLKKDKKNTTCDIQVSIIEPLHELSVLNHASLSRTVIPQKVVQDILGENNKSLKETQDILSKIDRLTIEMNDKKEAAAAAAAEVNESETGEPEREKGENERETREDDDELQMKAIKDVPPDIPDEMKDLMESTKDDMCGMVKAQCHIHQTIELLKQILKYEPVGSKSNARDTKYGIWNMIHKCTQNTIEDMQMVLSMKRTYINNMNKVCDFISHVDGEDDKACDLSHLHMEIDQMMQSQKQYNAKIKESTNNALNTLSGVIEKFVDPAKIDEINKNISKYYAVYQEKQKILNQLEQTRSVQLSPLIERIYKNKEKNRSLQYRISELEYQMNWMERLKTGRCYFGRDGLEMPSLPKASPPPNEYTIRLFAEQIYNDDELIPYIDELEEKGVRYMYQIRCACDHTIRYYYNAWGHDWQWFDIVCRDMDEIFNIIGPFRPYKPSLNCGIYGSLLHAPLNGYRPSLNTGVYGCVLIKRAADSAIPDRIKEKLKKLFQDNYTWTQYIQIWQRYHEKVKRWQKAKQYSEWKEENPHTTIEEEIVRLNELVRGLKPQSIETEREYHTLDRELRQKQQEWNRKINTERQNVTEYKTKFRHSSDDMNDIINRTGVHQRDIKDFLVLTKSLIPVMVSDQASTNSLSTKFECSYELIKRTLGPQPKSYKIKLFLQNTQQYAPKFDPYIEALTNNDLKYMHQVQCETKKEFKSKICAKLLIAVQKQKKKKLPIGIRRKFQSICIQCKEWELYFQQSTGLAAKKQQQLKHCYRNFATIFVTN